MRRTMRVAVVMAAAMMAARMVRAQLIPLLPPIVTESEEAATPQQSRTTELIQR